MTVKINGLPAGLKAEPVTVAGECVELRRQDRRRRQGRPGLGGNPGRDRLPDRKERLLGAPRAAGGQSVADQVELSDVRSVA